MIISGGEKELVYITQNIHINIWTDLKLYERTKCKPAFGQL